MDDKFYVYAHYIPNQSQPFYIGRGCNGRAYSDYGRSEWWKRVVNKYGYEVKILHDNLSNDLANRLEMQLIKEYGRKNLGTGCLINLTDGGDGMAGLVITEEHRKNNSNALKAMGDKHPSRQPSYRQRLSENNPTKRPEVREKISKNNAMKDPEKVAKLRNRKRSEETKRKISEANRRRVRTEESKEKTRQSIKKYYTDLKQSGSI